MNRIVREHYPVAKLPEELRAGFELDADVRVVVERVDDAGGERSLLDEVFAMRAPPYRTAEEIDADLRSLREEWEDRD